MIEDNYGQEDSIPADTVVPAMGLKSKTEEAKELRKAVGNIQVFEIGDCVRAARVGEAIQEGYMAAMSII